MIQKYNNMPNSVKASFWIMFCSILQKGISFITIPIFTRLLTPDEYGIYSLFLSWESIISIFATLNLSYQVFNNGMVKFKNDKDGYTSSMVGLTFISCLMSFITILIFSKYFSKISNLNNIYVILMFFNIFATSISGLWIVRTRYEFNYKLLTVLTIVFSFLNPLLGILFVYYAEHKILARIISMVLVSSIYGFITLIIILKKSKKVINLKYWIYALKIDLPLIPHYLSLILLSSSDRIMIGYLVNKAATAFYSISYNISMIMNIVITAINSSLIPWIYHQMENHSYDKLKKYINTIILLVAVLSIIPMFFGLEVVTILGGREYMDAASLIPIISASIFLIYIYSIFIVFETYFEKSMNITIGTIGAAILNLVTNYVFIKLYGYKAAAYTTLFSYMFLAIFHYIMMEKAMKENKIDTKIFNIKLIILLSIVIISFSLFITLIYDYLIVRYSILSLILVLLVINKKQIFNIFKSLRSK